MAPLGGDDGTSQDEAIGEYLQSCLRAGYPSKRDSNYEI